MVRATPSGNRLHVQGTAPISNTNPGPLASDTAPSRGDVTNTAPTQTPPSLRDPPTINQPAPVKRAPPVPALTDSCAGADAAVAKSISPSPLMGNRLLPHQRPRLRLRRSKDLRSTYQRARPRSPKNLLFSLQPKVSRRIGSSFDDLRVIPAGGRKTLYPRWMWFRRPAKRRRNPRCIRAPATAAFSAMILNPLN